MVLELWDLEDPTDGPDGHHFVLGLLACWCEDPLNLGARGGLPYSQILITSIVLKTGVQYRYCNFFNYRTGNAIGTLITMTGIVIGQITIPGMLSSSTGIVICPITIPVMVISVPIALPVL